MSALGLALLKKTAIPLWLPLVGAGILSLHVVGIVWLGNSPSGSLLANSLQIAAALLGSVSCLQAKGRSTGIARHFWLLAALAFFSWAFANSSWLYYENILAIPVPSPSIVHFFFNLLSGFFAMALFLNEERDSERLSWRTLLDFFQITIVLSFLYFAFYYVPALSMDFNAAAMRDSVISGSLNLAAAVLALIRLSMARSLVFRSLCLRSSVFLLFYTGFAVWADYGQVYKRIPTGSWYDLCWTLPLLGGALMPCTWRPSEKFELSHAEQSASFPRIAARNLVLGFIPLFIAIQSVRLPEKWEFIGISTLILTAACYVARLILGEFEEAQAARSLTASLAALRASEEKYRRFVAQSADGIFRAEFNPPLDPRLPTRQLIEQCFKNGFVAECNDALAHMFGFAAAADVVKKSAGELLPPNLPANRQFVEHFVTNGFLAKDYELRLTNPPDAARVFQVSVVGSMENGLLTQAWGIQRNVSEQSKLEEQLRHAQKMELVGRLAGGVAHDFNNILSVILGYSELSQSQVSSNDPVGKNILQIKTAADRAANLTRQLLAFSRKQVIFPQPLDLNNLISNAQSMLTRTLSENISITFVPTTPLGLVKADAGQMEQVLMNLIINARDAMPNGGQILISTAESDLDASTLRDDFPVVPGRYVMLVVSDSGAGMSEEIKSRIFEPFFTTKESGKGTGLGLATVYGIVKQAGGYIWVYSEPSKGATFKIYLPRLQRDERIQTPTGTNVHVAGGTETILVVEDDPALRKMTASLLRDTGYQVLEAGEARAAIHLAEVHGDKIHLMLSDVIMPGMSGAELSDQLLKRHPELEVLFMSGYTGDHILNGDLLDGGRRLLEKPFTKNDLFRKVRSVLDRAARGKSLSIDSVGDQDAND